jgi:hypothetical protein
MSAFNFVPTPRKFCYVVNEKWEKKIFPNQQFGIKVYKNSNFTGVETTNCHNKNLIVKNIVQCSHIAVFINTS